MRVVFKNTATGLNEIAETPEQIEILRNSFIHVEVKDAPAKTSKAGSSKKASED